jgi:hypothetical protein
MFVGLICAVTGGQTHAYIPFCPEKDEYNVIRDLQWAMYNSSYVFDALIRVRIGNGNNMFQLS